jgi:hypothetical protein
MDLSLGVLGWSERAARIKQLLIPLAPMTYDMKNECHRCAKLLTFYFPLINISFTIVE